MHLLAQTHVVPSDRQLCSPFWLRHRHLHRHCVQTNQADFKESNKADICQTPEDPGYRLFCDFDLQFRNNVLYVEGTNCLFFLHVPQLSPHYRRFLRGHERRHILQQHTTCLRRMVIGSIFSFYL